MDFFIAPAMAQQGEPAGNPLFSIVLLIAMIAVFYFLLIRPQSKRAKEHRQLVEGLSKGDEVVTNGGVLGRVTDVGETFATVEVTDGVKLHVQKNAVAHVMPKGTIKEQKGK